jgi:hypothetical protein
MIAYLYMARLFGIVPFLKIEENKLVATNWASKTSLFVQSFMAVLYLVYILNEEKIKYLMFDKYSNSNDADDVRYMFTCIVFALHFAGDLINICIIVLMSQKTLKLFNTLLHKFSTIDENISPCPKSKAGFFVILAASVFIAKTYYLFSRYDHFRISFNIGVRFTYGMNLVTELLISLTCMEIKSRYTKLHSLLKTSTGNCNLEEVRALHTAYSSLRDGHALFAWHVGKFLLTDISQMVMLITNGILSVYVICLTKEGGEQKSVTWCASNGIFATDCIWRMCFLVYNCGALQTEVCFFSFLSQNE